MLELSDLSVKVPLLLENSRISIEGIPGLWFLICPRIWIKWFLNGRENSFACDFTKCFTHCPLSENDYAL